MHAMRVHVEDVPGAGDHSVSDHIAGPGAEQVAPACPVDATLGQVPADADSEALAMGHCVAGTGHALENALPGVAWSKVQEADARRLCILRMYIGKGKIITKNTN